MDDQLRDHVMNTVLGNVVGVDVSSFNLGDCNAHGMLESLYYANPSLKTVSDALTAQFGSTFSESMLRFYSRTETMSCVLYDHLRSLAEDDSKPLCSVLLDFVTHDNIGKEDLAVCMRLLSNPEYVQSQAGIGVWKSLLFRAQQVLRLNDVRQVEKFVDAYKQFPTRRLVESVVFPLIGNPLSRRKSSGLPSGCLK